MTLERPDLVRPLTTVHEPRKAPVVMTPEEVASLLEASPGPSGARRSAWPMAQAFARRRSSGLKVTDIDSQRMRSGSSRARAIVTVTRCFRPICSSVLRNWWKLARPPAWLFPNQHTPFSPVNPRGLVEPGLPCGSVRRAGIKKAVSLHTLRRCFATHLLEQGVDVRVIQVLLGHKKLGTTALYTRVAVNTIRDVTSPLERLGVNLDEDDRRPPDRAAWRGLALEVADIFRAHGAAWRTGQRRSCRASAQLKVMSAIETCRTAALGGHVERCEDCAHERVAYNSCRNRHCPKCQAAAARQWLAEREAELLPVPYYHVVFTLPAAIGADRVPEQGRASTTSCSGPPPRR